ncbi:hypothetical protein QJS66_08030 [Kocuria rhizophila]|nr:hypothetical protein QJS66_08030 [Kocuria rhizophila]
MRDVDDWSRTSTGTPPSAASRRPAAPGGAREPAHRGLGRDLPCRAHRPPGRGRHRVARQAPEQPVTQLRAPWPW